MLGPRLFASLAFAALCAVTACGDDDDDGFFTAPDGPDPGGGGPASDAVCASDKRAPVLTSLSVSPRELWPPDHQMVRVTIKASATDPCAPIDFKIVNVRSNQDVNGLGDGDTAPDWQVLGPMAVNLRAERSGTNGPRAYTIRLRFADRVGNEAFESVRVWVPHDRR